MNEIINKLYSLQDLKYKDFNKNLTPNLNPEYMIGVRTPDLRKYATELYKNETYQYFLNDLPHSYFEENQLHAFIIEKIKDYNVCITKVNQFLPYIDNWATGDQMNPKIFSKHKQELLPHIYEWINSDKTYTIRYGIRMLMTQFLDNDFDIKYSDMVSNIKSEEYYVNMMIAWYFATALAKQYDLIIPYIEKHSLSDWVHRKTIQKAIESYRITDEQKLYLKSFR